MARFDILASITLLRSGEYLVMVSLAPRLAWSASSELEEARAATEQEAEDRCVAMVDRATALLRARGDDVGDVIGPRRLADGDEPSPR